MNITASVYGFGSAFRGNPSYKDIDILILYGLNNVESCRFAVLCKKNILEKIPSAHITMLSHNGEKQFSFIESSAAQYIGEIRSEFISVDVQAAFQAISEKIKLPVINFNISCYE